MSVSEKNAKHAPANARIERVAHPSPMSDGHSGPVGKLGRYKAAMRIELNGLGGNDLNAIPIHAGKNEVGDVLPSPLGLKVAA